MICSICGKDVIKYFKKDIAIVCSSCMVSYHGKKWELSRHSELTQWWMQDLMEWKCYENGEQKEGTAFDELKIYLGL